MKLTTKGAATRQRIIEGAAEMLRSDDPGDVTLDDIRAQTHTSKSQLFHYFPGGKEELLLAVARHEAGRVLADQSPHLESLTSWESWQAWRDTVVARYRAQGSHCPLGSLMNRVGATPGASEVVTTLLDQWQRHLQDGIEAMQATGEIRRDVQPQQFAAALTAGIQGGVQVLRSTGSIDTLEASLDLLIGHLRSA